MIIIPRVIILFTYFSDVKLHGIKALIITSGKGQAKQLRYCNIIKIHTHKHTINKIVEPCQVKQHGGSGGRGRGPGRESYLPEEMGLDDRERDETESLHSLPSSSRVETCHRHGSNTHT